MAKEAQRRARTRQAPHWPATTLAGPTGSANPRMGKRAGVPKGGGMFLSAAPTLPRYEFMAYEVTPQHFPIHQVAEQESSSSSQPAIGEVDTWPHTFSTGTLAGCCGALLLRCQPPHAQHASYLTAHRIASHRIAALTAISVAIRRSTPAAPQRQQLQQEMLPSQPPTTLQ